MFSENLLSYIRIVKKRGPQPFWTPVAPFHRVFSYPLSYVYVILRLNPFQVSMVGLGVSLLGAALILGSPAGPGLWLGVALLNLGVVHDACDGEVARYRIHHRLQSPKTYRVGMFADLWAYTMVVQALLPALLGWYAHLQGADWTLAIAGSVTGGMVLASYIIGFARSAYWPGEGAEVVEESFSFVSDSAGLLSVARRVYFNIFETAMFTTHASVVLVLWSIHGGLPWWALGYVAFVMASLVAAFAVATVLAFRAFDREGAPA